MHHETNAQAILDMPSSPSPSTIDASVESQVGVCLGETIAMVLKIANKSHVDLHSIHLALVRQISYVTRATPVNNSIVSPPASPQLPAVGIHPGCSDEYTYTSQSQSTTVHTATIPIAKVSNAGSTWSQQLQFRIPSQFPLIPTIDRSVTPLFKIDYFILISIPIPQRHTSLVSRLTAGSRKRSFLELPVSDTTSSSTAAPPLPGVDQAAIAGSSACATTASSRNPSTLQFAPIPIIIGTVSSDICLNTPRWPIPGYLDVIDRPAFVRDRFEVEMMQHFSSLESLLTENGADDDMDNLRDATEGSCTTGESDSDDSDSKDPDRFWSSKCMSRSGTLQSFSGLGTPPPSPSQEPTVVSDDDMASPPFEECMDLEQPEQP
ncbi:hypothetical protein BGX34_008560 [Mortierella sp. NVP85]|nr:hypothetical protein BGX34_008560 [Mortierella sp. NVP85]